jgi:hypothetical protein
VVWKTLGSQVKNVSSRYSAVDFNGGKMMGFNNIELISDRPLDLNLQEIAECIKLFPDRAMVVSLMADNDKKSWHELNKESRRYRSTWTGTEFWLPAWNDRTWNGCLLSGRTLKLHVWWWNG